MAYNIYCKFNAEEHKKTYINYLEVLILENGEIIYAVPSHQAKAEEICREKLGVTYQELLAMCPKEYYCDYLTWLLNICGAISVWNEFYIAGESGINANQKKKLKQLKLKGLYKGAI